jgi:hypothetical protein
MRELRAKSLGLLLLLVLACCISIDLCEGRRHWRGKRAPFSSLTKKKGKGKTGSHSGQGSPKPSPSLKTPVKPNPSPKTKPSPVQNPKPSPKPGYSPSPVQGKPNPKPGYNPSPVQGKPNPASPTPIIYNVVDFGAQGDGVCDDTKVCSSIYMFILKFLSCCDILWV